MKKCKFCQSEIDQKATRCPKCQGDLRNWISRHPIITILLVLFGVPTIIGWTVADNAFKDIQKPTSVPQKELNGKINFDGAQFHVTNLEDRTWKSCRITLNGKYRYPQEKGLMGADTEVLDDFEPGQSYTMGYSVFVLKDGTRFNNNATKVSELSISCDNGFGSWTW